MLNLLSDALNELIPKESLIGVKILEEESHKIIKFVRFELSTAIYFDRIKVKEIKPKGKYKKKKW